MSVTVPRPARPNLVKPFESSEFIQTRGSSRNVLAARVKPVRSGSHLSWRPEPLVLCRGSKAVELLPVTLLAPLTNEDPEPWARLWIMVWASSASSTTSRISCSCWSWLLPPPTAPGGGGGGGGGGRRLWDPTRLQSGRTG